MEYVAIEAAKKMSGLRLVLTGLSGPPWTEGAKALFHVKRIPYAAVEQRPMTTNAALKEWTGHENAPIAVYEDEKPRAGWAEIVLLAERLAPEPRLVPRDPVERTLFFGLTHEICGEQGLGWMRRLVMMRDSLAGRPGAVPRNIGEYLAKQYGYRDADGQAAPARVAEILRLLAKQLRSQRERGSRFLVGDSLSAADLYWSTFAALLEPLPAEISPLPDWLRATYTVKDPTMREALDPALLEHRDRIYREYLAGMPTG